MSKEPNVKEFMKSNRGQYILAQALHEAIKSLDSVKDPYKQRSNINDMKFILQNAFPAFKTLFDEMSRLKSISEYK